MYILFRLEVLADVDIISRKTAILSQPQLVQPPEDKPNNTGLPDNLKAGVESLSGLSLDNVKVHYNSSEPAQLNAHAYAQGTDIHLGPGQEQHFRMRLGMWCSRRREGLSLLRR